MVYHEVPVLGRVTPVRWTHMEVVAVAIAVGISIAVLTGGTLARILDTRIRWSVLLFVAFGAQLVLGLWSPGDGWPDALGFGVFVGTLAALLVFCALNLHLTGMSIVLVGAALNLLVVALNGGMPVRLADDAPSDRMAALERSATHLPEDDAETLSFLGDIIVLPDPVDRSISFGDLILGVGLVDVLVHASRHRKRTAPQPVTSASAANAGSGSAPGAAGHDDAVEHTDDAGVVDVGPG